jgi:hypothetical protein
LGIPDIFIKKPNMEYTTQQVTPPGGRPMRPKNWLVESILVTLFCCLPFGIAGIVFAAQVNSKFDIGDYEGAMNASKEAGKWTKIGFFIGIAVAIIWCIWAFLFGGMVYWRSRYSY